jgi:hypothetical protein
MADTVECFASSSNRSDLRGHPIADKMRRVFGRSFRETSLQQYTGTDVCQWHGKNGFEWVAFGPAMRIMKEKTDVAENSA